MGSLIAEGSQKSDSPRLPNSDEDSLIEANVFHSKMGGNREQEKKEGRSISPMLSVEISQSF